MQNGTFSKVYIYEAKQITQRLCGRLKQNLKALNRIYTHRPAHKVDFREFPVLEVFLQPQHPYSGGSTKPRSQPEGRLELFVRLTVLIDKGKDPLSTLKLLCLEFSRLGIQSRCKICLHCLKLQETLFVHHQFPSYCKCQKRSNP